MLAQEEEEELELEEQTEEEEWPEWPEEEEEVMAQVKIQGESVGCLSSPSVCPQLTQPSNQHCAAFSGIFNSTPTPTVPQTQ